MSSRRRPLRTLRHLLEYGVVLVGYHAVRLLPHRALFWVAAMGGAGLYAMPRLRRVILANLAVAFPDMTLAGRRRLARRNTTSQILTFLEFVWFADRPQALAEKVDFPDWCRDITGHCRDIGRPLIWATPHLGNWEVAGLKFRAQTGIPFAVVVRPFVNPWLDRMVRRSREAQGGRIIPDRGAVRGVMKALREGYQLATLIDQNTRVRDGGIFVDFFGLPVPTSRAPAMFARKLNAWVAVGGCIRQGREYKLFLRELPRPAAEYPDDESLIQDLMRLTEDIVREHPEQYLWIYERWRYIPADASPELAARYPFYATKAPPRFYDGNAEKE